MKTSDFWEQVKMYFNLMPDKEDEREIVEQISSGVSFRGANLWVLIFAIFIASLGLNVNSTAVIIGAMLISPLMGPIVGMGLAVGTNDLGLLKRAGKNFGVATLISVLTATIYFLLTPLSEAQSELLARTSPTLYDVLIAFCGGAAGIIALCTRGKGNVIPGVAIATALMPPLCTAGFGLATGHFLYFLGAFYLFYINTVFIALATFLGVKLLRFRNHSDLTPELAQRGRRLVTWVVVITMLPAVVMTVNIVGQNARERNVQRFVKNELAQSGTVILSAELVADTINIVAVGRNISDEELADARRHLSLYKLKNYPLSVIQGADNGQMVTVTKSLTDEITLLNRRLSDYTRFDTLATAVSSEVALLFPGVNEVRIGRVGPDLVAHVVADPSEDPAAIDTARLFPWLRTRLQQPALWIEMR